MMGQVPIAQLGGQDGFTSFLEHFTVEELEVTGYDGQYAVVSFDPTPWVGRTAALVLFSEFVISGAQFSMQVAKITVSSDGSVSASYFGNGTKDTHFPGFTGSVSDGGTEPGNMTVGLYPTTSSTLRFDNDTKTFGVRFFYNIPISVHSRAFLVTNP